MIHSATGHTVHKLLTLQDAMEQKKVVVYETGSVNELAIENLSSADVYIQSGDIVKGGRQDRVIPTDYILTSHSGRLPISSFCVEHGRWSKRGDEAAGHFSTSDRMVAFKPLKMAVREKNAQARVWNEVSNAQAGLASARAFTPPAASPTSMQLTLENKQLADAAEAYVRSLSGIIGSKSDVFGYAYAINGTIASADVYASHDLFGKMWPKLLRSSVTEAVAAKNKSRNFTVPDIATVSRVLSDAESGRAAAPETAGRLTFWQKDSEKIVVYETREQGGTWIHKNYVVK